MPTTSNFGWTTPADTDLVKDGAAAIRTLGNGIDTSMAQLKGGTTGQVLSKTSGTDMAFTWVTQDDANAIQNAIVDAKGDLIAATANDTPARLAVGNNGETLLADSSATTGLRYSGANQQNPIINSAFDIWQRGTSLSNPTSTNTAYGADRWSFWRPSGWTTGITMSRQTTSDTTNLPFIQYAARIQRTNGNTSTLNLYLGQTFDTPSSIPYAGKTVTLSFYARSGANFSAASSALNASIVTGTGTDQNIINGLTTETNAFNSNVTLTTTWQRFSVSGSLSSSATQIVPLFQYTPVGTAGANDYFEVTGVQIDYGSTALPFRRSAATLAGERSACERYYVRYNSQSTGHRIGNGFNSSTTRSIVPLYMPVSLRGNPSVTVSAAGDFTLQNGATPTNTTVTAVGFGNLTSNQLDLTFDVASGLTIGALSQVRAANNTGYIEFSAEL